MANQLKAAKAAGDKSQPQCSLSLGQRHAAITVHPHRYNLAIRLGFRQVLDVLTGNAACESAGRWRHLTDARY
jgi:hypothetical protein